MGSGSSWIITDSQDNIVRYKALSNMIRGDHERQRLRVWVCSLEIPGTD